MSHNIPWTDGDGYSGWYFHSLAPGRFEQNFRLVIFKLITVTDGWGISCKTALRWMPRVPMISQHCLTAQSHCLSQCWPRFMSPYVVTRPQWVNSMTQATLCTKPRSLIIKWWFSDICHSESETVISLIAYTHWQLQSSPIINMSLVEASISVA